MLLTTGDNNKLSLVSRTLKKKGDQKMNYYNVEKGYCDDFTAQKPHDPAQFMERLDKYDLDFITTAGHGYLVVPKGHPRHAEALKMCEYGFVGKKAVYLEEDCEAVEFLQKEQTK